MVCMWFFNLIEAIGPASVNLAFSCSSVTSFGMNFTKMFDLKASFWFLMIGLEVL